MSEIILKGSSEGEHRVILFGPPGAGKGTQGIKLAQFWNVPHVASGDILRQIIATDADSPLGRAARVIARGEMVSDEVAAAIVYEALEPPGAQRGFVLDGFPRNPRQARMLDAYLEARGRTLDAAIALEVDIESLIERLTGRLTCPNCGETFHVRNAPPKVPGICDRCGSALTVRSDDQPEAIRRRLTLYAERTEPLYDFYRQTDRLRRVDGTGSEDDVFARCLRAAKPSSQASRAAITKRELVAQ